MRCACASMNPGTTVAPLASYRGKPAACARTSSFRPTATMRPSAPQASASAAGRESSSVSMCALTSTPAAACAIVGASAQSAKPAMRCMGCRVFKGPRLYAGAARRVACYAMRRSPREPGDCRKGVAMDFGTLFGVAGFLVALVSLVYVRTQAAASNVQAEASAEQAGIARQLAELEINTRLADRTFDVRKEMLAQPAVIEAYLRANPQLAELVDRVGGIGALIMLRK